MFAPPNKAPVVVGVPQVVAEELPNKPPPVGLLAVEGVVVVPVLPRFANRLPFAGPPPNKLVASPVCGVFFPPLPWLPKMEAWAGPVAPNSPPGGAGVEPGWPEPAPEVGVPK